MAIEEGLRRRLMSGALTRNDVLALLQWQLSLPAEEMDCDLISECDLFLAPDGPHLTKEREDALLASILSRIAPPQTARKPVRPAHHRRVRKPAVALLVALALLAMAVAGVAYGYHRGVLNFTDGFGFAPMVSQKGAQEFVSSGALAHVELEHVIIDVLEAAYDGTELRVVYGLTSPDGELHLAEYAADQYEMPGVAEGEVTMCDYITINGQDAYFDNTWESIGEQPGQVLYYLQTNLLSWNVDVSGAEELKLGLPMFPFDPQTRTRKMLEFTIPAEVPEGLVRTATVAQSIMNGHTARVHSSVFSPMNGYIELLIEGLTQEEYYQNFSNTSTDCGVYAMDGSLLTDSHIPKSPVFTDEGTIVGMSIVPTQEAWPDRMVIAFEMQDYAPDWEAVIELSPTTEP